MGLKELLVPREKVFFQLLQDESRNVLEGARALRELILSYDGVAGKRDQIRKIEHHGDEIVHAIYDRLAKSFVTPIDRNDMGRLASVYDDVIDYIYATVNRLYLYEVNEPTEPMRRFADLIVKSVEKVNEAMAGIEKIKASQIEETCNEIDRLENETDMVLNDSVANLFKSNDAIMIIKLKEIYELMETVTDKCEDVGLLIRSIVLEYS